MLTKLTMANTSSSRRMPVVMSTPCQMMLSWKLGCGSRWFKVSLVESRQPKRRQWRAFGAKRVLDNDIDAAENANDLEEGIAMTRLLDFGQVTFGEVSTRPITIQNVDTSGPHTMVDRLSVGGCPIRLISPVEIYNVYFEEMTPDRFYPSIDFHPFKSIRYSIPPMVVVQLTVRVTGVTLGKFRCAVRAHFHGQLKKTCVVTVDIVGKDPQQAQVVPVETVNISTTFMRGIRMRFQRRCEEAERLTSLVESAKKDGIVPGPSRILHLDEKRSERRRALLQNPFSIPEDLRAFLNTSDVTLEGLLAKYPALSRPLDADNYDQQFHLLLYLEEHQEALDVRQFDMISSEMERQDDGQFKLKMYNLQEHRPSLVRGDLVSVRGLADLDGPRFHGRINSVT
ncbi:hypothetical protein RvY_06157 [Ramazzottius varieornatus]|uniref:Helicase MOV-10 helical domain-containing protein n=1 Tax=Ramazzottius varieornatus TaxID=947166 RepID=A0A1D1UXL1_RAMVA|nr:hypothetical protein RvY_06157 [Ramazzottius varieornatus]